MYLLSTTGVSYKIRFLFLELKKKTIIITITIITLLQMKVHKKITMYINQPSLNHYKDTQRPNNIVIMQFK